MEFRSFLVLAQKKQLKHDKEVQKINEHSERRKKERIQELANARSVNADRRRNLGSQAPSILSRGTLAKHSMNTLDERSPADAPSPKVLPESSSIGWPQRKSDSTVVSSTAAAKSPTVKYKPTKSFSERPDAPQNVRCKDVKPSAVLSSENTSRSTSTASQSVIKSHTVNPKPHKPSFSELLELAKKNVQCKDVKPRAFEDLIPCSANSKYRELDTPTNSCAAKKNSVNLNSVQERSIRPENNLKLNPPPRVAQPTNAHTSSRIAKSGSPFKTSKETVQPAENGKPRITNIRPAVSETTIKTDLTQKGAIARQLGVRDQTSTVAAKYPQAPSNLSRISDTKQALYSKPVPCSDHRRVSEPTQHLSKVKSGCGAAASKLDNKSLNEVLSNNSSNIIPTKSVVEKPKKLPTPTTGRGIAAQLGVCVSQSRREPALISIEDEDYETDDSFIDDSEAPETQEYARVVRDVHKALRFDPRKYKEICPWDDLRSMEANYREIEKEERRSSRLGAQEDAAEFARDLERKRQKLFHR